jgi:hypothetical protein
MARIQRSMTRRISSDRSTGEGCVTVAGGAIHGGVRSGDILGRVEALRADPGDARIAYVIRLDMAAVIPPG